MRRRMKNFKIAAVIIIILTLAEVVLYLTLSLNNLLGDNRHALEITFAILTPALFFIEAVILVSYYSVYVSVKNVKDENLYNLGESSTFYNYNIFQMAVKKIRKKRAKLPQHVICFTASNAIVMRNLSRNDEVTKYNCYISRFVNDYCLSHKTMKHNELSFCFYHGKFLIYLVGDDKRVNSFISDIDTALYSIAQDNLLKLFVQPFFGIYKVEQEDELLAAVENATIARDQSEKSFETSTYFNKDLKSTTNSTEIEEIRQAILDKEFVVYYQPKFNLQSKRFTSMEALIRWDSKKYGLLPPARFIPIAERGGLIHDIDMYVFKRTCEDLRDLKRRGRRVIPVSINFSLYEFYMPNFIDDIIEIIDENRVAHNLIEIEITETTSQSNPFLSISLLKRLKEKGLRVAMDDFGIGYSNFANLKKMPFDTIKIDKSFIDELCVDNKTREVVKLLVGLCHANGMEAVAEGVDSPEQVEELKRLNCDTIQGYFYSKPISKAALEKFLLDNPFERKVE